MSRPLLAIIAEDEWRFAGLAGNNVPMGFCRAFRRRLWRTGDWEGEGQGSQWIIFAVGTMRSGETIPDDFPEEKLNSGAGRCRGGEWGPCGNLGSGSSDFVCCTFNYIPPARWRKLLSTHAKLQQELAAPLPSTSHALRFTSLVSRPVGYGGDIII